jgi:hypothetical protein
VLCAVRACSFACSFVCSLVFVAARPQAHAPRWKDGDLSKDTVKQELARKSSTWTACVLSDMEALNIGGVVALEREANNRESFRELTSAYTQI